ncbi:MAG: type I pantothenate kinase [Alphaproteobacteria bacterium]
MERSHPHLSPYQDFSRDDWAALRADTPLTLTEADLADLRGLNEPMSMRDVEEIYLPLSRLLNLFVAATQGLFAATNEFLGGNGMRVPYIVGVGGSVAVGKSTTARILRALLARWSNHPKVALLPTDGFLLPNAQLEARGLMERKGFPESYDLPRLLNFLSLIKAGRPKIEAPVYSHLLYDVVPGKTITIDQPDILIVEGLNVLQPAPLPRSGKLIPYVSDFFDFSIYVDADEAHIKNWYVERFLRLRETTFRQEGAYFSTFAQLSDVQARDVATDIWSRINLVNLKENILPTRRRASLILRKSANHAVERVLLRRI